jgi:hypothetical protein
MAAGQRRETRPIDGLLEGTPETLGLVSLEMRPEARQDHLPLRG